MAWIAGLLAPLMVVFASPALSERTFVPLSGQEIRATLTNVRVFYVNPSTGEPNGIWQMFRAGGATLYAAGGESWGRWHISGDQYCSTWPPSTLASCYDIMRAGNQLQFLGSRGDIYQGVLK